MNPIEYEKICIALDVDSLSDARQLIYNLPRVQLFKIGPKFQLDPRLYSFLKYLQYTNISIFLDFKSFEIDSMTKDAISSMIDLGIDYTTVHANRLSLQAAVSRSHNTRLKILAVVLLTTFDKEEMKNYYGYEGSIEDFVVRGAKLAVDCGCAGVVCSPREVAAVRAAVPNNFKIVCPGIRPSWYHTDEHVRIGTPEQAINDGADIIVIGRPVVRSQNVVEALNRIISGD